MTQDLNLYTMQTLFEQPLEPIDFLVDGLFAQGLYILGGSPKVGKSWLALQLCLAVCTGTRWHCSSAWRCAQEHLSWGGKRNRARCFISHWRTAPNDCIPVRCV